LQEIWLRNNALSGNIPTEIGLMESLENVYLSNNALTGTIPSEIGLLENFSNLHLFNNSLEGSIPDEIELLSMTELYINDNFISGTIPSELLNLTSIPMISVYNTNIARDSISSSFFSIIKEPCIICDGDGSYNFVKSIDENANRWVAECSKNISDLNNDDVAFMSTIDKCNLLTERCVVCHKDTNTSG